MSYIEEITAAIEILLAKATSSFKIFDATVVTVDEESRTCIVHSEKHNINNLTVRLMPEVSDGCLVVPSIDSTVIVVWIGITDPFMVSASWADKNLTIVGQQGYQLLPDSQIFNDGKFGGLAKIIDLTQKLNNLENKVNALIKAHNTHVHPGVTLGPDPTPVTLTVVTGTLTLTKRDDIENKSITHGEKM